MRDDSDDVDLADLQARVEALHRKSSALREDVWQLEEENERLRERVADLEELVDPDPGATEYEDLSKPRRVYRLRKALVEQAASAATGKAAMTYNDVKWLFDGLPSDGYCYELMKRAAGWDPDTQTATFDGFGYGRPSGDGGDLRVTANIGAVNDETLLHAVNNASEGGRV